METLNKLDNPKDIKNKRDKQPASGIVDLFVLNIKASIINKQAAVLKKTKFKGEKQKDNAP